MILPAADELLAPVMAIDGLRLACLIDASTGMVLASLENNLEHQLENHAGSAAPTVAPTAPPTAPPTAMPTAPPGAISPPAPTAAAGAADVFNVLTQLNGRLATGENLQDVMVTFSDSFFMVRPLSPHGGPDQEPQILLLVIADRRRTNLAMAHRSIRDICASFTS
jgi:hypothetical protein